MTDMIDKQALADALAGGVTDARALDDALAEAAGKGLGDKTDGVPQADHDWASKIADCPVPKGSKSDLAPLLVQAVDAVGTDRVVWTDALVADHVRIVLPLVLRVLAVRVQDAKLAGKLGAAADACETDGDEVAAYAAIGLAAQAIPTDGEAAVYADACATHAYYAARAFMPDPDDPSDPPALIAVDPAFRAANAGLMVAAALRATGDPAVLTAALNAAAAAYAAR